MVRRIFTVDCFAGPDSQSGGVELWSQIDWVAVDSAQACTYHRAPMSNHLPRRVDVARQVQARSIYEGALPLADLRRLRGSLAATDGEVSYVAEFGKDAFGVAFLALHVDAGLPLVCQRTLETFVQPVSIDQRLGLVASEADEAALPAEYEPLLVTEGDLSIADVIEDELILALPVVPLAPGAPLDWKDPSDIGPAHEPEPGPFEVLGSLRKH